MNLHKQNIDYKGDPWFTIYPIGDVHLGTLHCDRNRFRADVKKVEQDPNGYWVGTGDFCESIVMSDPRFSIDEIAPEFLPHLQHVACAQRDAFISDVKPIADKCIGLLEGNHEYQNRVRHYVDVVRDSCRELGTNYLSDAAMIRLTFRRTGDDGKVICSDALKIFACHGHGGGRKTGGKVNKIEDLMDSFEADIYLMGHVHSKLTVKRPRLSVPSKGEMRLISKTRVGALTGCYYRTYEENSSSYGQRVIYAPTELGGVAIRFRPMTGEIQTVD